MTTTDKIEREIVVKATKARVWKAISDAKEFGNWFGVNFKDQKFEVGKATKGNITIKGYDHVVMEVEVTKMEPERTLAFTWHPYAVEPETDYSKEPPTLVTFTLEDADGGTRVKVVESGFDKIPAHRRDEAYRMNSGGWEGQMKNIAKHVDAG